MQDSASFWTDIKKLEEQLTKSPDSFCFARLSEVYLKVGLVDDALHVARQGVMKHPGYLSGQRSLSMACHAKGLNEEALAALKLVTEALPEDVPAQKLMGRLYAEAGNQKGASQAFRTALEFAPDDTECRIELESFERSVVTSEFHPELDGDDEEIIEDLEILEEDQTESEFDFREPPFVSESENVEVLHHDPLSTVTLAELYVTQGFIHKSLEIYRAILAANPADRVIAERVVELEVLEAGPTDGEAEFHETFEEEAMDESMFSMPVEELIHESESLVLHKPEGAPQLGSQQPFADISAHESGTSVVPTQGIAENASSTLNGWLENIRRFKSCR